MMKPLTALHAAMKMALPFLLLFPLLSMAATNPRPFTIPAIHEWKGGTGHMTITPQSRIFYADARLKVAADAFAADWLSITGQQLSVCSGKKAAAGDILFAYRQHKRLGAEGYTLAIGNSARVTATAQGALHAAQTLLQMAANSDDRSLPCGTATDRPDYPMRGLMLDCGRKYIPLDYLRRLVRTMAYYKMNTLSLHLNDNGFPAHFQDNWDETYAAFRLESERFPGLTAEDGSYSKADFRQFVLEAARQGVEVIPEIDVPAHSLAFSHYRPSLGSKEFGMDHLELTNPEVIPFLDSLFAEYIEGPEPVFAGPRVHIGTDEYSNRKQDIVERFRALTDHLIHTVESYGKQATLWGALTHARGTTPVKTDDVLMYCWYNGYAEPDSMRSLGYQLLSIPDGMVYIVPAAGYYYDYLNIPYLYRQWTPAQIGNKRFEERDPQIRGGMFAVWNDNVGNGIAVADIHHRVFPALQVIAEKSWAADTVRTCDEWQRLATALGEAPGINDLGRYPQGIVVAEDVVSPSSTRSVPHIGWPYRISFDIEAAAEERGTALFRSDDAEFYLADPVSGRLGFVRDSYLFTFRHTPQPGTHEHIAIEGDNNATRLYVDGRLVQTLGPSDRYLKNGKTVKVVRTLRFPLQRTDGTLRSRITNLRVESLSSSATKQ